MSTESFFLLHRYTNHANLIVAQLNLQLIPDRKKNKNSKNKIAMLDKNVINNSINNH
jgi:hypothetical protein